MKWEKVKSQQRWSGNLDGSRSNSGSKAWDRKRKRNTDVAEVKRRKMVVNIFLEGKGKDRDCSFFGLMNKPF